MENNSFFVSLSIDDLIINSVINKLNHTPNQNTVMQMHSHSFNEIFAVIRGELTIELSHGVLKVPTGSLCIIPAGVFHFSNLSSNAEIISVRFDYLKDKHTNKISIYDGLVSSISNTTHKQLANDDLCEKFKTAYDELKNPTFITDTYVKALLTTIYLDTYKEIGIKNNQPVDLQSIDSDSDLRLRIEDLILENLTEKITAKEFAEKLHFSERQLNRLLNKFYGKSFKVLLTDIRLERSAKLLINSNASIEEIARLSGYSSVKNFNLAFTNKFSITPKNYRKFQKLDA